MFREDNEGFFTMVSCAIKMIHVILSPGKLLAQQRHRLKTKFFWHDNDNDNDYDDGDNDGDDQVGRIKEIIIPAGGENVAPVNIEEEIKSELQEVINEYFQHNQNYHHDLDHHNIHKMKNKHFKMIPVFTAIVKVVDIIIIGVIIRLWVMWWW